MRPVLIVCFVAASIVRALSAAAQDAASDQQTGLPARVHPGQSVWVTTSDGTELHGRVAAVSRASLAITTTTGEQSIPMASVRTIEAPDSRRNGVRNGALIGGASLGVYMGLLAYSLRCERDCGAHYSATRDTVGAVAWGAGVGAGGALLGLWIDGLIKSRQVVYAAPATRSAAWQIRPVISSTRRQLNATIRW